MIARRDTGDKKEYTFSEIKSAVPWLLKEIQSFLYKKAEKLLEKKLVKVKNIKEAEVQIKDGNLVYAQWCGAAGCEEQFKEKTGAKSLNSPLKQPKVSGQCFNCSSKAKSRFYFGKSY